MVEKKETKVESVIGKDNAITDLTKQVIDLNEQIDEMTKENISLNEQIVDLKAQIEELTKTPEDVVVDQENLDNKDKVVEEVNPFLEMSIQDCKNLCKEAEYPESEWKSMNTKTVRDYLFTKYKEDQEKDK